MMSTGPHPEKLAVQRVGEPGPRVPITGMGGPKRPFDIVPFEAPQNMRVGRDVFVIIVIDEVEMQHRPVNGERQKQQCQANQAWRREGLGSVHRLAETETFHSRADFASRHKPSRRCVWAATSFAGQHTATVAPASSSAPNRLEPSWPPRRCRVFCVSPTAFVPAFCESCMARHYSRATNNSEPKSAVSGHLTCGLFSCYSGDEPQSGALPSKASKPAFEGRTKPPRSYLQAIYLGGRLCPASHSQATRMRPSSPALKP